MGRVRKHLLAHLPGHESETFLTEAWAHLLENDATLARRVLALLTGRDDELAGAVGVATQVHHRNSHGSPCVVDLELSCGELLLLVENRLDASLPPREVPDVTHDQLGRYLRLGVGKVVLVSSRVHAALPAEVLEHPRYLQPASLRHFTWSMLFPLLQRRAAEQPESWLHRELVGLFDALQLLPPDPLIGELGRASEPEHAEARARFKQLLIPTYERLLRDGWSAGYLGSDCRVLRSDAQLFVSGRHEGRASFVVRLSAFVPAGEAATLAHEVSAHASELLGHAVGVRTERLSSTDEGDQVAVTLAVPRVTWLAGVESEEQVSRRIDDWVTACLTILESAGVLQ